MGLHSRGPNELVVEYLTIFPELANLSTPQPLIDLLKSSHIWSALYHGPSAPFLPRILNKTTEPLGANQPPVRRSAWMMLLSLLKHRKGINLIDIRVIILMKRLINLDDVDKIINILSSAVLRSAWVEPDPQVRSVMWEPLLTFLTREVPAGLWI